MRKKFQCMHGTTQSFFWGGGSGHDKLPKLARQMALKKSLRIKDQSCPVLCLSHNAMW